jgi:hypothetical protein
VLEEELNVRQGTQVVEQDFVELSAVDGALKTAMNVVCLGLLGQGASGGPEVDHSAMHWDCPVEDLVEQIGVAGRPQCVDATFRKSKVDRLCKVERCRFLVSKVCGEQS